MQLLRFSFENMERLKFWAPYFRNIPNKRELYSKYLFQRKHVPLLQDVQLVRSIGYHAITISQNAPSNKIQQTQEIVTLCAVAIVTAWLFGNRRTL